MLQNYLTTHLPAPVDAAIKKLGADLKTARVRRSLTVQQLADEIGVSRHLVAVAERGKPTTGIAVYAAILAELKLLDRLADVADPREDKAGLLAALVKDACRVQNSEDSAGR